MKKQGDNPYYDLISLTEWTDDNEKKIVLLSHCPHMADGLSIRGMYEHFYNDSLEKENFLKVYSGSMGLTLKTPKERMCEYARQFVS